MRIASVLTVFALAAACSAPDGGLDAPMIDAPVIDAPVIDAPVIDAPVIDAPFIDAPVIDAPIDAPVIDAAIDAPIDAPVDAAIDAPVPPACLCDTGPGCQGGCTCDPGCGPLRCAQFLPSHAYFANRGGSLHGVAMADALHGWAVGGQGMIWKLIGTVPTLVESPTTRHLSDVEVVDFNTGWAVGDREILRLENGVWRIWTDYVPPGRFNELELVDDANGIAVGGDGLVAQLRDGVWSTIQIGQGPTEYMLGVALADRDNGRVFGSRIYQLRDGVWSSIPQVGQGLYTADLVDRDNGWGVGQQITKIHRLLDGVWTAPANSPSSGHAYGIKLLDINTGWATKFDSGIWPSKLMGGSWGSQPCNGCNYPVDIDIAGDRGWTVGGQYLINILPPTLVPFTTTQQTWNALTFTGGTTQALVAVAVTGESEGWAVGTAGTLSRLTPTGWVAGPSLGVTDAFRGLALSDATHGWAVGGNGRIARLDSTWSLATSPTTASLYGVAIAGTTAWAVGGPANGQPGTILRHGGAGWSLDPFVPTAEVHALALTDAANGWAVGGDPLGTSGIILRLQNGVWTTALITPDAPLWSIALDGAGNGWAVGGDFDGTLPVIWRLEAGVWARVLFTGTGLLHGVAVDAAGLGWIVGTNHTVLAISSFGVSPCPIAMPWPVDLSAVALTPQGRAWVVGTEGMRARTP